MKQHRHRQPTSPFTIHQHHNPITHIKITKRHQPQININLESTSTSQEASTSFSFHLESLENHQHQSANLGSSTACLGDCLLRLKLLDAPPVERGSHDPRGAQRHRCGDQHRGAAPLRLRLRHGAATRAPTRCSWRRRLRKATACSD